MHGYDTCRLLLTLVTPILFYFRDDFNNIHQGFFGAPPPLPLPKMTPPSRPSPLGLVFPSWFFIFYYYYYYYYCNYEVHAFFHWMYGTCAVAKLGNWVELIGT